MPDSNSAITLAVIGILATCVGGLIWIIKHLFTKIIPMIEANTKATVNADTYLQMRNGRDIKMHTELLEATKAIPGTLTKIATAQSKAIIKAVKTRDVQLDAAAIEVENVRTDLAKGVEDRASAVKDVKIDLHSDDANVTRKVQNQ